MTITGLTGAAGWFVIHALWQGAILAGVTALVFGVLHRHPPAWRYRVGCASLALMLMALALYSGFAGAQSGIAHFAHLGGYAGAFLYLKWLDRSRQAWRRKVTAPPKPAPGTSMRKPDIDLSSVHEVNRAEVFSSRLPSDPGLTVEVRHGTLEEKRVAKRSLFGRPVVDRRTG